MLVCVAVRVAALKGIRVVQVDHRGDGVRVLKSIGGVQVCSVVRVSAPKAIPPSGWCTQAGHATPLVPFPAFFAASLLQVAAMADSTRPFQLLYLFKLLLDHLQPSRLPTGCHRRLALPGADGPWHHVRVGRQRVRAVRAGGGADGAGHRGTAAGEARVLKRCGLTGVAYWVCVGCCLDAGRTGRDIVEPLPVRHVYRY